MRKLACSQALSASNGTKGSLISTLERMVVARHCSGPFRGPDIYGGPDMLFHCSLSKVENGITSASSGCARQGRYTLVELQSFWMHMKYKMTEIRMSFFWIPPKKNRQEGHIADSTVATSFGDNLCVTTVNGHMFWWVATCSILKKVCQLV